MKFHAVLTGDIVSSTALPPAQLDQVMDCLEGATRDIGRWAPGLVAGFARRGGDGWQMALDRPRLAFRATLYAQAMLRRMGADLSTRIAVADGEGTLPPEGPNAAHGPAFTASGRALTTMDRQARLTHAGGGAEAAAYHLADAISRGWTQAQARALCEMLPPLGRTQAEASETLNIGRSAVQQALAAADYKHLSLALQAIENPS